MYRKVLESECWRVTGKPPIGTRWVDINKGDDEVPEYRSRLAAQELSTYKRDDLFAARSCLLSPAYIPFFKEILELTLDTEVLL